MTLYFLLATAGTPSWKIHVLSLLCFILFIAAAALYRALYDAFQARLLIGDSKFLDLIDDARIVWINGRPILFERIKYKLKKPEDYKGKKLIVVGGGNSAVKAALELVTYQHEGRLEFRSFEDTNEVTIVVRGGDFDSDLKYGSKVLGWHCINQGIIKAYFGAEIKEIREDHQAVLIDARTREETSTLEFDCIFNLKCA